MSSLASPETPSVETHAIVEDVTRVIEAIGDPEVQVNVINALTVALRDKKEEVLEARAKAEDGEYLG